MAQAPAVRKEQKIHSKRYYRFKEVYPLFLMALPGVVYMVINNYIPMAGLVVAFKNFSYQSGIWGSEWADPLFKNFKFLFMTDDAWTMTFNTLFYNVLFIALNTVLPIIVAIFLNEVRSKALGKVYQTVILTPYLISMVIISYIAYGFLSVDTGLINKNILEPLGLSAVYWYSDAPKWRFILPIINTWKSIGFYSVVYYASIVGIDPQYYEAAELDGAGKWKQTLHITLPMLKPTIITMVLIAIGKIFYSDFGLFYNVPMNSGMIFSTTQTIDTYVYRALMNLGNIGMAAAAGFYQSIVGFILVLSANLIVRRIDKDNALF